MCPQSALTETTHDGHLLSLIQLAYLLCTLITLYSAKPLATMEYCWAGSAIKAVISAEWEIDGSRPKPPHYTVPQPALIHPTTLLYLAHNRSLTPHILKPELVSYCHKKGDNAFHLAFKWSLYYNAHQHFPMRHAVRRGHGAGATQRPSPGTRSW